MNNHLNESSIFSLEEGQSYYYPRHNILKEGIELHSGSKITIIKLDTQENGSKNQKVVHFKIEHSGSIQETVLEENLFHIFFSRYKITEQNKIATSKEYLHEDILAKLG